MKWERGKNPYLCNHFAALRVGPNTTPQQLVAVERNLKTELAAGGEVLCVCGHKLDEHEISSACRSLLEPRTLAEELLLVHPQPAKEDRKKVQVVAELLHKKATLPLQRNPIPLRHSAAVFWFMPAPGPEAVELPTWEDFGLVKAGDPEDLALDIVFDS